MSTQLEVDGSISWIWMLYFSNFRMMFFHVINQKNVEFIFSKQSHSMLIYQHAL